MHVAIISARRPDAPAKLLPLLEGLPGATWYVAEGEGAGYLAGGAGAVVEAGALCEARNAALDAAGDDFCLQLSDDLRGTSAMVVSGGRQVAQVIRLVELVHGLSDVLASVPRAHLAGVAPTANTFYAKAGLITRGFIVGDLMLIRPGPLRFDTDLLLKEDYDFTCQHLARYGLVARADWLLADFAHRTNAGGAVAYRTGAAERAAIARLKLKWPGVIVPNPRRRREVLLRWPR